MESIPNHLKKMQNPQGKLFARINWAQKKKNFTRKLSLFFKDVFFFCVCVCVWVGGWVGGWVCGWVRVRVRVCVCAGMRACVRARVYVCVLIHFIK